MRAATPHGFSIVESLVALALMATVSAALLPAVALAARLQRESALETEGVTIAASTLERLRGQMAPAALSGGDLDTRAAGWHAFVDREGAVSGGTNAAYECRWQITRLDAPSNVAVLQVRVIPLAAANLPITLSTAVRDE